MKHPKLSWLEYETPKAVLISIWNTQTYRDYNMKHPKLPWPVTETAEAIRNSIGVNRRVSRQWLYLGQWKVTHELMQTAIAGTIWQPSRHRCNIQPASSFHNCHTDVDKLLSTTDGVQTHTYLFRSVYNEWTSSLITVHGLAMFLICWLHFLKKF